MIVAPKRLCALAIGAAMGLALVTADHADAVNIQDVTSPGGITAWLVEDYTVPIVTMNFAFRGGSSQDGAEKAGTANFMSGMLDEGAADLDSKAFQTRLRDHNITLNFDTGRDAFYGNLKTLKSTQAEAFDLMRIAVTEPRFDQEPVDRLQGQILSSLKRAETNPGDIARKNWSIALFPEHPYGLPNDGTVETVSSISADDLADFHGRLLARDNLYIAVVGAISAEELAPALDAIFGKLPAHAQLRPITDAQMETGVHRHLTLGIPQTTIRLGGSAIKRDDDDFIAAYIANHILGGGSFSSRLYREIREKRGLAYSVGTSLIAYDHAGAYVAAAATRADAAQTAIDIMIEEIQGFAETGPTEDELARAKDFLTGNYALRFDNSQKIARQILGIQLDDLGIDYIATRNDKIRAISSDDVRRAANRVFGGEISIVTVGPGES